MRFACDGPAQKDPLRKAVNLIRAQGYKYDFFVYVLVIDVDDAHDRVEFCRSLDLQPFAQPFRGEDGSTTEEARRFARWVNHKAIFKTVKWEDYKG